MIYSNPRHIEVPNLDLLTLLFAKCPSQVITKARARDLTRQFAYFLRHQYGVGANRPGRDVVVTISTGQSALVSDLTRQIKDGPGKVVVCSEDVKELALSAAHNAGLPTHNVLVLKSYPEVQLKSADGALECDFGGSLDWRRITDPKELEYSKACVLISHQNMVSECYLLSTLGREAWERLGNVFPKSTLGHLPAAHIAALQGYLVNSVYEGSVLYWMPRFNFDDFVRYFAELKLTFFFSVPPIFMAIMKHPAVKDQFKSVEYATAAAAPMSHDLQESASRKLKGIIYQVWGLSETTGTSVAISHGMMEGQLVDENDNDVEAGRPGEALIKGPMITKGYHNNPEANKSSFAVDGWFRTGDVLKMEGDLLYMELIKYKGLQVAPAELEGVLTAHPSVADTAVIGTQREDTEVPTAYVALAPSAKGKISEAELVDYVQGKVSDHKRLRGGVIFIDVIPRSPTGKILRKDLRALYSRHTKAKI
ncbi:acetyl-CoA synthetase-like protein [Trichoderma cornu-damae]|uniref:Acetyl-CoA synthetase-like protein n=1 Tax=Trichoderma cornu-damae TaxID=654480 RepID=A0A9P8TZ53_9HYPO|nr:acetyl-CoA synthetase-like protein [Trichoderma cornu-damae]